MYFFYFSDWCWDFHFPNWSGSQGTIWGPHYCHVGSSRSHRFPRYLADSVEFHDSKYSEGREL